MGIFISFEGPEGSGKTTQVELLKEYLVSLNLNVITTREPGGSFFGKYIREIILDPEHKNLCSKAELLLYLADRAQHVFEKISPNLENNKTVIISDRFADATLAYQGYGRGLDTDFIKTALKFTTGGLFPDITFFIDVKPEITLNRAKNAKQEFSTGGDRLEMESIDFHNKVYSAYKKIAEEEPDRVYTIDGNKNIEDISLQIRLITDKLLKKSNLKIKYRP